MASTLLSGAAFGAAMVAAGFHHPSVVISQLKFENFHMFQAFLTATASSAVIYTIGEQLGYVNLEPRSNSPLGILGKYDGNVIGGALLGVGMAMSGSCPGTLFAQMGAGTRTGLFALQGAVLGGIMWTGFISKAVKRNVEKCGIKGDASTFSEQLSLSRAATLALFETICIGIIASTTLYTSNAPEPQILGVVGGLLIGGAQLFSLVTRRSMMGVSGSFEEVGNWFWKLLGRGGKTGYGNMVFASGVFGGAWVLAQLMPGLVQGPVAEVSPLLATVGGALMIVGARMAGGCTSGHGISGISLLSTSSIITIASCFAAGGVVASLVH